MLITRETDYALRILRALSDEELLTVGEICKREFLPQQFAYKILKKLSGAGIVKVTRGAEGGCRLTADLAVTTLYDLMVVMGEDEKVTACMDPDYHCPLRESRGGCGVHCQLARVQQNLDRELKSHSLRELIFE